jgi:hypothetical protein
MIQTNRTIKHAETPEFEWKKNPLSTPRKNVSAPIRGAPAIVARSDQKKKRDT